MVCLLFISHVTHHHVQFKSLADTVDSTKSSRPTRQPDRPDGCPRPPHTRYHYPRPKCHLKGWRIAGASSMVESYGVGCDGQTPTCFSNVYPKGLRNISTVLYYILFTWMSKTSQHEKPIRIGMIPSDSQCQGHDCTNTLTRTPKGAAEPHKIHSMKSPNLLSTNINPMTCF